jgi:hypothetical protein
MGNPPQPAPPPAAFTGSTQSCTIEMVPRQLKMHTLSEVELDALAAGGVSIHLTFFGLCMGAVISFGIVLYNGGRDAVHTSSSSQLLNPFLALATERHARTFVAQEDNHGAVGELVGIAPRTIRLPLLMANGADRSQSGNQGLGFVGWNRA